MSGYDIGKNKACIREKRCMQIKGCGTIREEANHIKSKQCITYLKFEDM